MLKPENWGLLHHGVVVYLDMEAQDIYDRYTPLANILISIFSLFIKSHIEVSTHLSNCFHHAYLLTQVDSGPGAGKEETAATDYWLRAARHTPGKTKSH